MVRIDYQKRFPAGAEAMAGLERAVRTSTLEPALLELVRVRVSQINGLLPGDAQPRRAGAR
ncbi:MAG: hypothetical protein ACR2MP_07685 [Streptosporangiaceae bacterium]